MICTKTEKLIPLAEAMKELPGGGSAHLATAYRWAGKGIAGVKLETLVRGGRRYTSIEALNRFIEGVTVARDGQLAPTPPTDAKHERQRRIDRSEKRLAARARL